MAFADQILPDFDDRAQVERRLVQYCRVVCVALTIATVQYLWMGLPQIAVIVGAGALAMVLGEWTNRRGSIGLSVILLMLASAMVVFSIMWVGSGLQDSILLTIPVLLLVGSQLLRPRFFAVLVALILAGVATVGLCTLNGSRQNGVLDTDFNRLTDSVLILSVGGALLWYLSRDVQFALQRLRREILRHQASEKNLTYLAQHDALTRLPNRRLGTELMGQAMAAATRHGDSVALLFVDLDNFKTINDSLGHAAGDEFLQQVAQRLRGAIRKEDLLCRQGGDEFLIGLTRTVDLDGVAAAAAHVLKRFSAPFTLQDTEILPTCSIGISVFPKDGETFEDLLRHADLAMYEAKKAGRNAYRFFDDQMGASLRSSLDLLTGLRMAVAKQEFVLYYQPVIDMASGQLVGAEALVRWQSPVQGRVPPNEFIPAAEKSGLIVEIGQWVLEEACRQMRVWHDAGAGHLTISVNLSPVQFRRGNIEAVIERALEKSGLSAARLDLEVTESTLVQDTEQFIQSLRRIKSMGAKISIDDFGTGYSNLSYLQRFAVDRLKVDQSFVRQLTTNPQSFTLVTAIVQMAKGLGLAITAEGVEDQATLQLLQRLGCDHAQGYLFAKPLTADEFAVFQATWKPLKAPHHDVPQACTT